MTLIVCGLGHVPMVIAERRPSHMITLLDPATMIPTPLAIAPERHLKLGVNDIAAPMDGLIAPDETVVSRILAFGETWDESAPLLIHCWAGISRSTAAAFILACERSPAVDEHEIARTMRRAAGHAYPNRRIVALADALLGRRGRMIAAVEAMGGDSYSPSGHPFDFAVRH